MARVAVCVPTYRRPEQLGELLQALGNELGLVGDDVRVLVVDNDPDGSAKDVVAAHDGLPVTYVLEPQRGLSAVRNRILDETADDELVAFIDDDELPRAGWLRELLRVQEDFTADVVTGPALLLVPDGRRTLTDSGVFERRRFATGPFAGSVHTNNVLFRTAVVREAGTRFDPFFGLSAGEDTDFFWRLREVGASIAWADDAVVSEVVHGSRLDTRFILRRAYAMACTYTHVERRHRGPAWCVARQTARVGVQLLRAMTWLARSATQRRRGYALRSAWHLAYALGTAAGLARLRANTY